MDGRLLAFDMDDTLLGADGEFPEINVRALRACAEPTRLRLLALAARGSFCVMEFTEILGQSQPRLSRHLRLLGEAGLLDRLDQWQADCARTDA